MDKKKIIGVVYAYDVKDEYAQVIECGFQWIRIGIPFPWADKMNGKCSEAYLHAKDECKKAVENGLKVMGSTFGMGSYRYSEVDKTTKWRESIPDFVGEKGSEEYYQNISEAAAFICCDLNGLIHGVWQCMNEIDIPTFAGEYPRDVVAGTARASAKGITSADPDAKCGINLSRYHEEGLEMADIVYGPGHCFGYIGDDQYFGSWQGKDIEQWNVVIEALYSRYKLPVLINEWGYSSGGKTLSERPDPALLPLGWPDVCYENAWFHDVEGGHTEAVQAEYIRRGFEIFAGNPHVLGSFMFCWKDAKHCYHCGQENCPSECFWGLLYQDGKPKPAYFAAKKAISEYY